MTISKNAWNSILTQFVSNFYYGDKVSDDLKNLIGIQLVSNDILAKLRNTPISIYPDRITGALKRDTCKKWVEKVFKEVLVTLNDCPDVLIYVVCIDRFGARRMEKMATFLKRQRKPVIGAPEFVTIPPGQTHFFEDDKQMPGTMDQIFSTYECKMAFYDYITSFIQTEEFRSHIPPGKSLILSGALKVDASKNVPIHLPPVQVFQDRVESLSEFKCDHISEGDLDVWRWPIYFKDYNCCTMSYDGDVFSNGLLLMNVLVPEGSSRRIIFLTRRSIGSEDVSPSITAKKKGLKRMKEITYETVLDMTGSEQEAYRCSGGVVPAPSLYDALVSASSSSSSSSFYNSSDRVAILPSGEPADGLDVDPDLNVHVPREAKRKAPVWALQYADLVGIRDGLVNMEYDRQEVHGLFLWNPAAAAVVSFLLASDSHDYIPTKMFTKGLGSEYVWLAFQANPTKFRDLVMLSSPTSPTS